MKFVFSGDMCVGENTSRPANVRVVRLWQTASALQRAVKTVGKGKAFFDKLNNAARHGRRCLRYMALIPCSREMRSAIMAMHSLLVGFPLAPLTV